MLNIGGRNLITPLILFMMSLIPWNESWIILINIQDPLEYEDYGVGSQNNRIIKLPFEGTKRLDIKNSRVDFSNTKSLT